MAWARLNCSEFIDGFSDKIAIGLHCFGRALIGAADIDHFGHFQDRGDIGAFQHALNDCNVFCGKGGLGSSKGAVSDLSQVLLIFETDELQFSPWAIGC